MSVKTRIFEMAEQSATFRKIGGYFEANWEKLLYVSASEVAQKAGVSQGSVSRFCQELGYAGFAEFQKSLQHNQSEEFTSVKRMQNLRGISNEIQELLEEEKNGINKLPDILAEEDFEHIVNALVNSKKVVLLSGRMSATILAVLQYHLQKIRDNVVSVTPGEAQWDVLEANDPKDCFVLAITFPRYHAALIRKLERMKQAGYQIGLLSDSVLSPAVGFAKYHLELPIAKKSIFDSYSIPILFINIMVMEVAKKIPDLEKRLEVLERVGKLDDFFI